MDPVEAFWQATHREEIEAFWLRVDQSGGPEACWPWLGGLDKHGYGRATIAGVRTTAHRHAWELTNGPIPGGLYALHRCDNPPCCNPGDLFLGTQAENLADMRLKGRSGEGRNPVCGERLHLSVLTEPDVRVIRDSSEPTMVLAARYDVDRSTIRRIVRGETWKQVDA